MVSESGSGIAAGFADEAVVVHDKQVKQCGTLKRRRIGRNRCIRGNCGIIGTPQDGRLGFAIFGSESMVSLLRRIRTATQWTGVELARDAYVPKHLLGFAFWGKARQVLGKCSLSASYCDCSSWMASIHSRRVRSSRSGLPSCQRSSF